MAVFSGISRQMHLEICSGDQFLWCSLILSCIMLNNWSFVRQKACGINIARFLKYVQLIFNITHERVTEFFTQDIALDIGKSNRISSIKYFPSSNLFKFPDPNVAIVKNLILNCHLNTFLKQLSS